MRRKSKGTGFMLIKVDLEKTSNRISWDFIRDTLDKAGLLVTWNRNITHCVETVKISLFWNGKKLKDFRPSRGIRQGDAINPYLFALCMEKLGHILNKAVEEGRRRPIKLSRRGPSLSHLFTEANVSQMEAIMDCLNSFCISFGQKISPQKYNMAFSAGVDETLALRISALSKIPITTKMGKYNWNSLYYGKDEDGKFPPYFGKY